MGYSSTQLTGKFPGCLSLFMGLEYAAISSGLGAATKVPAAGRAQILACCAFVEASGMSIDGSVGTEGTRGDFGFEVLPAATRRSRPRRSAPSSPSGGSR